MRPLRSLAALGAFIALALATSVQAQNTADARAWGDRAMAALQAGGIEALLDIVEKESFIGQTNGQQLRDMKPRVLREWQEFGGVLGWEHVGEVSLGSSLRSICYIARGQRLPALVAFRMYRAEKTWNVINFVYFSPERVSDNECRALWK